MHNLQYDSADGDQQAENSQDVKDTKANCEKSATITVNIGVTTIEDGPNTKNSWTGLPS